MKTLLLVLSLLSLAAPSRADELFTPAALSLPSGGTCAPVSPVCEKWKQALPARYADDFKTCDDDGSSPDDQILACGQQVGHVLISFAKAQLGRQLLLQLTASLGIADATTTLVLVGGAKAFAAYEAVKFLYNAFKAESKCYYDHDFKRSILEPVAEFYPAEIVDYWVQNRGCSDLSMAVYQKVQAVEQDINERRWRQKQYDEYASHGLAERGERMFPASERELSATQQVYLDKKSRMEKATPLFQAAGEILSCMKPTAIARTACGFVAELGWAYSSKSAFTGGGNDAVPGGIDPALKSAILHALHLGK